MSDNVTYNLWPLCHVRITLLGQSHTELYEGKCWHGSLHSRKADLLFVLLSVFEDAPPNMQEQKTLRYIYTTPTWMAKLNKSLELEGVWHNVYCMNPSRDNEDTSQDDNKHTPKSPKLWPCQSFCGILKMNEPVLFYVSGKCAVMRKKKTNKTYQGMINLKKNHCIIQYPNIYPGLISNKYITAPMSV